jgi:hypothetical protein
MTGHFTSYENRTDHELATAASPNIDIRYILPYLPDFGPTLTIESLTKRYDP